MKKEEAMIMVEREELILSPTSPNPSKRIARFLTPSLSSPDAAAFDLPLFAFTPSPDRHDTATLLSKGFTNPLKDWVDWVEQMRPIHEPTWKKAGIFDAIINSTYSIPPNKPLVVTLAENWCSLTNSFIFLWGEATISLEDIAILGGYSILGDSVSTAQIEDGCDLTVLSDLAQARAELNKTKSKKPTVVAWARAFMGAGGPTEHAAFLVLWLSRHVFKFAHDVVGKHLHGLACRLAGGTRVALAPAVLASLYRDLTILKKFISNETMEGGGKGGSIWSPMHLVQIWAWERFPEIQPPPNPAAGMARWDKLAARVSEPAEVRSAIDSASRTFLWRPYGDLEVFRKLPNVYPEKEKWVRVGPGMREDFKSFAKIVRVSELVGVDCVEHYFPHRVARQFGMDQDVPGLVGKFDESVEFPWRNYDRLIRGENFYIPPRGFRSGVTSRYLEWWEKLKLVWKKDIKGKVSKRRKSMAELLLETTGPSFPRSKRQKVVFAKGEKSGNIRKEAAKAIEFRNKRKGKKILDVVNKMRKGKKILKNVNRKRKEGKILENLNKKEKGKKFLEGVTKKRKGKEILENVNKRRKGQKIPEDGNKRSKRKEILENVNKEPGDCMSSSGVELRGKQPLELSHGDEISDNQRPEEIITEGIIEDDEHGHEGIDENEFVKPTEMAEIRNDNKNEITYGDRLSGIQSLPHSRDCDIVNNESIVEPEKVCENAITRGDKAVVEDEGRVRNAGDNGDGINKIENEIETNINSYTTEMLKAMPLEARISRLEILVARWKEEMKGFRSV